MLAIKLHRKGIALDREERIKEDENLTMIENEFEVVKQTNESALNYVADQAYAQLVDAAKLDWQAPVNSVTELAAVYPNALVGYTVMAKDTGIVHRYDGASWGEIQQIDAGPVNELDTRLTGKLAEKQKKLEYKEKQSTYIAKAFEKIRTAQAFSVECNGDSLSYGHDTTSADIRPADSTLTPSGDNHTATRASTTYPEALDSYLSEVYGSEKVIVYNRGFSGDTTQKSFNHWTTPSGADIAMVMLGTNDASQQTIEAYLSWYRKIIERHLDNGTAVIILTPPKTRNTTDTKLDSYINALYTFAKEYGILVVDVQEIMSNYSQDIYSDGVHFNGKGYSILGARLSSIFIGDGILNPKKVGIGSSLSVRPMVDSVIFKPGKAIISAGGFPGPDEQVASQGIGVALINGDCAYYSVYVDTDDVVLSPSIYFPGSLVNAEISLDFGTEIPHMTNDFNRGATVASPTDRPTNPVSVNKNDANIGVSIALAGFKSFNRSKLIHVTKKGWHTLKIKCIDTGTTGFQLHSVDFTSIRDLLTRGAFSELTNHGLWTQATLQNSATHNGTYPLEYRKNKSNYMEIRGAFTVGASSSGTLIFTLPVGLRPDRNLTLVCSNSGATPMNLLVVRTNGIVELGSTLASGVSVFIGSQGFEATQ